MTQRAQREWMMGGLPPWVGAFTSQALPGCVGGCFGSFPLGWSPWSPEGSTSFQAFQSNPPRDHVTGLRHNTRVSTVLYSTPNTYNYGEIPGLGGKGLLPSKKGRSNSRQSQAEPDAW